MVKLLIYVSNLTYHTFNNLLYDMNLTNSDCLIYPNSSKGSDTNSLRPRQLLVVPLQLRVRSVTKNKINSYLTPQNATNHHNPVNNESQSFSHVKDTKQFFDLVTNSFEIMMR